MHFSHVSSVRVSLHIHMNSCFLAGRAKLASRDQRSNLISLSNTWRFLQGVMIKKRVHQCTEPHPSPWQPVSWLIPRGPSNQWSAHYYRCNAVREGEKGGVRKQRGANRDLKKCATINQTSNTHVHVHTHIHTHKSIAHINNHWKITATQL